MDLKRKLIGALFAVIAGSGLLIACGPQSGDACDSDLDCIEGEELCAADKYCAFACDGPGDCLDGEVCTTRTNADDGSKVCLSSGGKNPPIGEVGCKTTEECQDELDNDDAYCESTTKTCKIKSDTTKDYITIQIQDETSGDRCNDITGGFESPGTKLTYVQLTAANGTTLGYGKAVGFNFPDSEYNDPEVLDGSPHGLGANQCIENLKFEDETGIALGCGGYVLVQFKKGDQAVTLENGQKILVGAYGKTCSDNKFDPKGEDKYSVYVCTAMGGIVNDASSCSTEPMNTFPLNDVQTVTVKL